MVVAAASHHVPPVPDTACLEHVTLVQGEADAEAGDADVPTCQGFGNPAW